MPKRQSDSDMDDPKEFAAWAFAAGVPDPRYKSLTFQAIIPAPCCATLSELLWDLGFRHHADLQTKWVPEYSGADRNLLPLGTTDVDPNSVSADNVMDLAREMVDDQFPDVADRLRQMNPENRDELARQQAQALFESLSKLKTATSRLDSGVAE